MAKRLCDIVLSTAGLILLSPLFFGIAVAVRVIDGASVLFRQTRVGRDGADFTLVKFRTMTVSPDADRESLDLKPSSRITRLGAKLRRSKLDELPQLWNVLKGDMAVVGPRPEVRRWVEAFPDRWAAVLTVRPGITDPASIEFRHEGDILAAAENPERVYSEELLPRKLQLYDKYVKERSFSGDLWILARTLRTVLFD